MTTSGTLVAVDPGRTGAKRLRRDGDDTGPLLDEAARVERASPQGQDAPRLAEAALASARRDAPGLAGLCVLSAGDAAELGLALGKAAPGLNALALPHAVCAALAVPHAAPPEDGALDLVLDLGHASLRLGRVRWHAVDERLYPQLEGQDELPGPGGAALDAALLSAARLEGAGLPAHELTALVGATRGPWLRRWTRGDGAEVAAELTAADGRAVVAGFLAQLAPALAEASRRAGEAGAARVILAGGLAQLAPVRRAALAALAGAAPVVVVAQDPLLAAARGALLALERPPVPRAPAALRVVLREASGVGVRDAVPAAAALPGRFGPVRARAARAGDATVQVVLGDSTVLEARLPLPAEAAELWLVWAFGAGWSVEGPSGASAPLVPASPAGGRAVVDALAFPWSAHGAAVPLDLTFVFRATQGGSPASLDAMGKAMVALATVAATTNRELRLRAIAVGDYPQGHLRPAYVTQVMPRWTSKVDELAQWTGERLGQPIDGIDAAEAYEAGLKDAVALDWRADAERCLVVLSDVPAHLPTEPPFSPIDWRVELQRLKDAKVRIVPVHVSVGGVPPQLRRLALQFLEGLGAVETLKTSRPGPELERAIVAAASARRLDATARRVLDGIALSAP